jgi:hypothetical protein
VALSEGGCRQGSTSNRHTRLRRRLRDTCSVDSRAAMGSATALNWLSSVSPGYLRRSRRRETVTVALIADMLDAGPGSRSGELLVFRLVDVTTNECLDVGGAIHARQVAVECEPGYPGCRLDLDIQDVRLRWEQHP